MPLTRLTKALVLAICSREGSLPQQCLTVTPDMPCVTAAGAWRHVISDTRHVVSQGHRTGDGVGG